MSMLKHLSAAADAVLGSAEPIPDQLREAVINAGGREADLIRLFPAIVKAVKNGKMSDYAAVAQMRAAKPKLFREFDELSDSEFRHAESAMKAALHERKAPVNDFKDLDYSLLTDDERTQVDLALRGRTNSVDRGVLERARARIRQHKT